MNADKSPRWWALAVAALFAVTQVPSAPGRFPADSAQYLNQVYALPGESPLAARHATIEAFCAGDPACVRNRRAEDGLAPGTRPGAASAAASQADRLHVVVWLLVAVGLPLLLPRDPARPGPATIDPRPAGRAGRSPWRLS